MTKDAAISIAKGYELRTGKVLGNLEKIGYDNEKKSWVLLFDGGKAPMEDEKFVELFSTGSGIFIVIDDLSGEVTQYETW